MLWFQRGPQPLGPESPSFLTASVFLPGRWAQPGPCVSAPGPLPGRWASPCTARCGAGAGPAETPVCWDRMEPGPALSEHECAFRAGRGVGGAKTLVWPTL